MKIAVFGTGMVGQTLAAALFAKGHTVTIGTRDIQKALANVEPNGFGMPGFGVWHKANSLINVATFENAAAGAQLLINATNAASILKILQDIPSSMTDDKVLIDLANDLDMSNGMPPRLRTSDVVGQSIGERIQTAFPKVHVVKTLNTMNCSVMLNPTLVAGGQSTVFIGGNSATAKVYVSDFLKTFGWTDIIDLGDITSSRATEMLLPIWLKLWPVMGQTPYNFKIAR
jgi:8-hydroxy-5-deazaflavin:NADPH oxidoreductase